MGYYVLVVWTFHLWCSLTCEYVGFVGPLLNQMSMSGGEATAQNIPNCIVFAILEDHATGCLIFGLVHHFLFMMSLSLVSFMLRAPWGLIGIPMCLTPFSMLCVVSTVMKFNVVKPTFNFDLPHSCTTQIFPTAEWNLWSPIWLYRALCGVAPQCVPPFNLWCCECGMVWGQNFGAHGYPLVTHIHHLC